MSSPTINPASFRLAFEAQIAKLPADVQRVHRTTFNALTDIYSAIPLLKSQIDAIKTANTTSGTGTSNVTENITNITEIVSGGGVNDQSGNTVYLTQQSDNGSIIIFNDSSPIAVTMATGLGIPYWIFPTNMGTGLVTLTPQTGTISYGTTIGASSMPLSSEYFAIIFYDGTDFWACTVPTGASALDFTQIFLLMGA